MKFEVTEWENRCYLRITLSMLEARLLLENCRQMLIAFRKPLKIFTMNRSRW